MPAGNGSWSSPRTSASIPAITTDARRTDVARGHLHHEGPAQDGPAEARDPEGDLAVLLLRREDRRHRAERSGEVLAPAHHGGRRRRGHGRGLPREGGQSRGPPPGAASRPEEDGP